MGGYFSFSTRSDSFSNENVAKHQIGLRSEQICFEGHSFHTLSYNREWVSESLIKCSQSTSPPKQSLPFQICMWTLLCVVTSSQWETTVYIQPCFLPFTTAWYNHVVCSRFRPQTA